MWKTTREYATVVLHEQPVSIPTSNTKKHYYSCTSSCRTNFLCSRRVKPPVVPLKCGFIISQISVNRCFWLRTTGHGSTTPTSMCSRYVHSNAHLERSPPVRANQALRDPRLEDGQEVLGYQPRQKRGDARIDALCHGLQWHCRGFRCHPRMILWPGQRTVTTAKRGQAVRASCGDHDKTQRPFRR